MADHRSTAAPEPPDPFLERRLGTLAVLPVPERPSLDELAGRGGGDRDRAAPSAEPDGDHHRSHRVWLVSAAATIVLALIVAGAVVRAQEATMASGGSGSLVGREFWSTSVTADGVERPIEVIGSSPGFAHLTVAFDADSFRAGATCNSFSGPYRVEDGRLIIDETGTTQMLCVEPLGQQDEWLTDFLTSSPTIALDGDRLTLTSGTTVIELLDRGAVEIDPPSTGTVLAASSSISALFGPRWELQAYGAQGERTSVEPVAADGGRPWLQFDVDQERFTEVMRGEDGCSRFGSDAEVDGASIRFRSVARLTRSCADAERKLIARVMGEVLRGQATYETDGSRLVIRGDVYSLELVAAPAVEEGDRTVTKLGRWSSSVVAADDRSITFEFGCARDGAEAFDHVVVDTSWDAVRVTLVVREPIEPSAGDCTDEIRGAFTVELDEPVAGRAIVQPSDPGR